MEAVNIHSLLREQGLRVTPQRVAIAELLFEKPTHETAQTIYETLKSRFPSISPNTIYLTLAHFERSGLVTRLNVAGSSMFDSNTAHHDHAFCQNCNKLLDIPTRSDVQIPTALSGWDINRKSQVYSGICPDCIS